MYHIISIFFFFFQAEDGIRDYKVTGVQTCALPIFDARYLETALREWKEGLRKTDPSGQMTQIAKSLSDTDIKALAAYYASRPPPQVASAVRKPSAGGSEKTRAGAATQPRE